MMPNAKDYTRAGYFLGLLGAPATGKSEFVLSCAEDGPLYVALSPASELDTYAGHDVAYDVFQDERWRPSQQMWEAGAFRALMKHLYGLLDNPVELLKATLGNQPAFIAVDTVSAVSDLIWHEVMKQHKTEDPTRIGGNSYGPYVDYRGHLTELMQLGQMLAAKGSNVLFTFHVQARETEGLGTPRRASDGELAWDEQLLPDVRSALRANIARFCSGWLYATPTFAGPNSRYEFTIVPQQGLPARVRALRLAKGAPTKIANNWRAFRGVLEA